jgi:hypothetical protein
MRRMLIAAVLATLGLTSRAAAQITAFWQRATITPAAIAEEPALANMQSWDLMVTTTGNWASAGMHARLPISFTYYKHALGGQTRPDPLLFDTSPALAFTTYASAATDDGTIHTTAVLGSFLFNGEPGSIGDPTSFWPGAFDMNWGNYYFTALPGTYQIARLTFPAGVVFHVYPFGFTNQVRPDGWAPVPQIPEPDMPCVLGAVLSITMLARPKHQIRLDLIG